jgi:hypothetical protein
MFRIEDLQAYMMRVYLEYAVSVYSKYQVLRAKLIRMQRLSADEDVDMVGLGRFKVDAWLI